MNLRTQVIGINQLLSDIYQQQMRLSNLLSTLDFDEQDIQRLRSYHLPDTVAIFLVTLDRVITLAKVQTGQLTIVLKMYGLTGESPRNGKQLSFDYDLSHEIIKQTKQNVLAQLTLDSQRILLESELKDKIQELLAIRQICLQKQRIDLIYFTSPTENCFAQGSLAIPASSRGKEQQSKSYSLKEIRKTHQRAYAKWTRKEEEILLSNLNDGLDVKEIAQILERKPGAISSRINKLGLTP